MGNKDYKDVGGANKKSDHSQNIARRLIEKNKERQLKQKTYRKEHELKLAFSEFYLSLILLQNYQTLNHTGFRKILKKHDKVTIFRISFDKKFFLIKLIFLRYLKQTVVANGLRHM